MKKIFGIDLGTTNSAIAHYVNGAPEVIKNSEEKLTTPSFIFFSDDDTYSVGEQAKADYESSPENGVKSIKRQMGRNDYRFKNKYSPEQLSSFILKKLAADASENDGIGEVKDVIITVPAAFDDAKRKATEQAGEMAGLNVVRILNEPTAAAISFAAGLDLQDSSKVLVYDLGGGTFDVTILEVSGKDFNVLATDGNPRLGGDNFDAEMLELIKNKVKAQEPSTDLSYLDTTIPVILEGAKANSSLSPEEFSNAAGFVDRSERTKLKLSNAESTKLPIPLGGGKIARIEVTREEFENATKGLLDQTEVLCGAVLAEVNLQWNDIEHVVMVGGSSKMPMVKNLLERLSGKEVNKKTNLDTAVAEGAAILGYNIADENDTPQAVQVPQADKVTITDVCSQNLGVIQVDKNDKDINTVVIAHNTPLPAKKTVSGFTVLENKTGINIQVTEGDDPDIKYVKIIGTSIVNLEPHPKGFEVLISYEYDVNQMIHITVEEGLSHKFLGEFDVERKANMNESQLAAAKKVVDGTTELR